MAPQLDRPGPSRLACQQLALSYVTSLLSLLYGQDAHGSGNQSRLPLWAA